MHSKEIQTENFLIVYENINPEYIKRFAKYLEKDVDTFQRKIGKYPDYKVKIIVAKNDKDYLEIIKPKKKIIEFSNAVYFPGSNTIVIKNPKFVIDYDTIHRVVLHEYIHSFVHYYFYNPPLWFNEGMAVYFSGDFGIDRELRFVYSYLLMRNPLALNQMKYDYPKNRSEWEFFYSKSALAVKYLYTKNINRFIYFWSRAHKQGDFYKTFRLSYLMSVKTFSKEFEKYCKTHFKLMIVLASSTVLWGLMPILLIIIFIKKKLKYRKIYKTEVIEDENL